MGSERAVIGITSVNYLHGFQRCDIETDVVPAWLRRIPSALPSAWVHGISPLIESVDDLLRLFLRVTHRLCQNDLLFVA